VQAPAKRVGLDVVDEQPLPVELDDGQPLAVARLEIGVAVDRDLLELEAELGAQLGELRPRPLAERAALGVVEGDPRYGYRPRVIVASATRPTPRP
jgi:hypothetical protein